AAHLGLDDLDAALLAHDATVLHALVLAAVALVVLHRAKDLGAEQTITLRLERAVVDRLRLLDLAVAPLADFLRRGELDADRGKRTGVLRLLEEVEDVLHLYCSLFPFVVDQPALPILSATSRARAARPAGIPGCCCSARRGIVGSSTSSTSRHSAWSSLRSTLNDSGRPASSTCSPLTIDSYMRVRPSTSSDLTVKNSCSAYAAP